MSLSHPIRLDTRRPLLVSGDPLASLRAGGVDLHGPSSVGRLLREHPSTVREHYFQELAAGVDVLCCVTVETMPRDFQQSAMPALLAGKTVELAREAAEFTSRPIIVAGVLGNREVPPAPGDRLDEELEAHARTLATAGCDLILVHGSEVDAIEAAGARRAAIVSGIRSLLPTWAVISLDMGGFTVDGLAADTCARLAFAEGAQLVLFEVPSAQVALTWTNRLMVAAAESYLEKRVVRDVTCPGAWFDQGRCHVGFAPAAGSLDPDAWSQGILGLLDAGTYVIGGGPGTTLRHLAALSGLLRRNDPPPSGWPSGVSFRKGPREN